MEHREMKYQSIKLCFFSSFTCGDKQGIFADTETGCQAYHYCSGGRQSSRSSFLCPIGTVFSQEVSLAWQCAVESLLQVHACDWWYNVDCTPTKQDNFFLIRVSSQYQSTSTGRNPSSIFLPTDPP